MEKTEPEHSIARLSAGLLELLMSKRYRSGTLINYRRTLASVEHFMKEKQFKDYTEEIGEAFLADRIDHEHIAHSRQRSIRTILRRLNELYSGTEYHLNKPAASVQIPAQYTRLLEDYLSVCTRLGNKKGTIFAKRSFCGRFLSFLLNAGCEEILNINTNYICSACLRFTNKDAFAVVKSFLRYLYERDLANFDYSGIVPKYRKPKVLPTTYTHEEIRRLENAINQNSKAGKRDSAILLLATRLGMRSGDIVRLSFENIDFERGTICLTQNKTDQPLSLPLLPEIKEAILEYVWKARPPIENKFLFLRENAPFERITTSAMRLMLTGYFKAAGIDISSKRHGPHALRSSLASSMINSDVPYEVVRKLLGHADPQAIRHYAKVDMEHLRRYAIEVPPPSGIFADILQGRVRP
jgi:site-specific recombinase XerD